MDKQKREKIILMSIAVIVVVGFISAFSLAALKKRVDGNSGKVVYKAGDLEVILDESGASDIELENAIPTTDEDGSKLTPYSFSIKNNGEDTICYELYLDDDEDALEECNSSNGTCNLLQDSQIKYQLVQDGSSSTKLLSTGRMLSSGSLGAGESSSYQLRVWLDYDADNSAMGKYFFGRIRVEASQCEAPSGPTVAEKLQEGVGDNGNIDTSDPDQTFITGTNPNNYIWYSGKLWRAVSIDPDDNSVKLVTQWNISTIQYTGNNTGDFNTSHIKVWLNDTKEEGFLGNLREPEKFIKMDSVWQARSDSGEINAADQAVSAPVGLINIYEYTKSYTGASASTGYLHTGLEWWFLSSAANVPNCEFAMLGGVTSNSTEGYGSGIRPAINLKGTITIVSGSGTDDDPYRLWGDADDDLSGEKLASRYSGEYVTFGTGENTLYRIVSHEGGGTRLTSTVPLKSSGTTLNVYFNDSSNSPYLSDYYGARGPSYLYNFITVQYVNNYLTTEQKNMLAPMKLYFTQVGNNESYLLAKYTSEDATQTIASVLEEEAGILRLGELMAGQFSANDSKYWLITAYDSTMVKTIDEGNFMGGSLWQTNALETAGIKPLVNISADVIITGGDGTKGNPFTIALGS